MNILFLNGSPKGKNSITIQTANYFEKRFPNHSYEILHVGQRIKMLEKDFTTAKIALEKADLIIFCYPVYTFIAPYQMHRFIELLKESDIDISNKFVAQFSTSKHFYDVTAHNFIEENCYDLGLLYLGGLSADMNDLQNDKGIFEADCFFNKLMFDIENDIFKTKKVYKSPISTNIYQKSIEASSKTADKDIVLITNIADDDENLRNMIDDFKNACEYDVREINIRNYKFSGGCLGCFHCTISEKCIYKDGFDEYLRTEIQNADGMVMAFSIENHYTHSSFKCYDDRQFCNGHRTTTAGKCVGYIVSGNLSSEDNLKTIIEARSDVSGMYYCGTATDENNAKAEIINLAKTLSFALNSKLSRPQNFYGVGGTKIFRDLVYEMRGFMQADHKFYKKHGIYDFPHKKHGSIFAMQVLGLCLKSPKMQKKIMGNLNEYIIMPYKKIIEKTLPYAK